MRFFEWFFGPKPALVMIIRNVLGEEIDRMPARDLYNQDLRGKQWMHADLSGMSLFGANRRARICLGLAYTGQIFKRLHSAVQS